MDLHATLPIASGYGTAQSCTSGLDVASAGGECVSSPADVQPGLTRVFETPVALILRIFARWHDQYLQTASDGDGQYTGGTSVGPFWGRSVCGHCRVADHDSAVRQTVQGSAEPESGWGFSPCITGVHVSR